MTPDNEEPEKTVNGRVMLLVTSLLVVAIVALAVLAGPFGRELTIRQQPTAHWTGSGLQ